jgi:hypothetical protein
MIPETKKLSLTRSLNLAWKPGGVCTPTQLQIGDGPISFLSLKFLLEGAISQQATSGIWPMGGSLVRERFPDGGRNIVSAL